MAGDFKTSAFMLGDATIMLQPFDTMKDPFAMTPVDNSIGMTEGVTATMEGDELELKHGVLQNLIDSKRTNVRASLNCEVFEYTAQNLFYGAGLARTATPVKRGKLKNAVTGAVTTIVIQSDPIPNEASSAISAAGDIPSGATILIQRSGDATDYVYPVRVTAATTVATGDYTVTCAIPTGVSFAAGDRVWVVNEIPIADEGDQSFFSLKLAGRLANNDRPIALLFPKVKITKGFNLSFDAGNYGNMPFEFRPYKLSVSEAATGRYAEIGTGRMGMAYAAG